MINEFTSKKLGEVLTFAKVGKEIFERGRKALGTVFTDKGVNQILHNISEQEIKITNLAEDLESTQITLPKSEKTGEKLRKMMELYVGEEWDNPAELLEWLGFFEGAAIVHWKLVEGAAEVLQKTELRELTRDGIEFHSKLLSDVSDQIKKLGYQKAAI